MKSTEIFAAAPGKPKKMNRQEVVAIVAQLQNQPKNQPNQKMNDLEIATDLCLNYKTPKMEFDQLADQIRLLELEIKILNRRLDELEDH